MATPSCSTSTRAGSTPSSSTSAPSPATRPSELKALVTRHAEETGSTVAAALLEDWDTALGRFTEVMPRDYKRVLDARAEAFEEGLDEDEANARIMEVLHG